MWIEKFHTFAPHHSKQYRRYSSFFEPKPQPEEKISDLATLRDPNDSSNVVFTGVIHVGSPTSEKFIGMIKAYLADVGNGERKRRRH